MPLAGPPTARPDGVTIELRVNAAGPERGIRAENVTQSAQAQGGWGALSSNRTGPSRPVDLLLSLEPALADDVHHGVDGVAHQEGQLLTFGHREVPWTEAG